MHTTLSTSSSIRGRQVGGAAGRRQAPARQCRTAPPPRPSARSCAAAATERDASAAAAQLDRRSLLLSLLVAGQVLSAEQLAAAAGPDTEISTVFVAGATGRTGRRVVQQLRAAGYRVRAGVRDVRKAQSLGLAFDSGIQIVEADVTKDARTLAAAIGDAQAVICATGATGAFGSASATAVDEQGTIHLIDAAAAAAGGQVKAFVLLTSLLTNAAEAGQANNSNYKLLNLFGGVLDHKLAAERYLRASGLRYTIVRPGGLSDKPPEEVGQLVTSAEDTLFGLDSDPGRAISRDMVAQVLVAALRQPGAANKVLEIVASPSSPVLPEDKWYSV